MNLFTIGYEGMELAAFLDSLEEAGVQALVDVRMNPNSRKPGFSKNKLAEALASRGIEYLPFPALGTPRDIRDKYKRDGDWDALISAYQRYLAENGEVLREMVEIVKTRSCCLCCYEADVNHCHRRVIADEMLRLSVEPLTVVHLSPLLQG